MSMRECTIYGLIDTFSLDLRTDLRIALSRKNLNIVSVVPSRRCLCLDSPIKALMYKRVYTLYYIIRKERAVKLAKAPFIINYTRRLYPFTEGSN